MSLQQSRSLESLTPPKGFSPAQKVQWAAILTEAPGFVRNIPRRGAKRRGINYEKKVQEILRNRYGERYLPNPWILFSEGDAFKPRYCQPDGLLFDFYRGKITIVEVKYNHCELAWWQLHKLYLPVVSKLFGPYWEYPCCEVVKWFDPATKIPEAIQMQKDIEFTQPGQWGVNILNPSRL